MPQDYFNARDTLKTSHGEYTYYRLSQLETAGLTQLEKLPYSIRVLLESVLRLADHYHKHQHGNNQQADSNPDTEHRLSLFVGFYSLGNLFFFTDARII